MQAKSEGVAIGKEKVELILSLCSLYEGNNTWKTLYDSLDKFIRNDLNNLDPRLYIHFANRNFRPQSYTLERAFGYKEPKYVSKRNNQFLEALLDCYIKKHQADGINELLATDESGTRLGANKASWENALAAAIPRNDQSGGGIRYNIPRRPNYFIGREEKLVEIHRRLTEPSGRRNILLLNGIGGMGKTTLMQEYLHSNYCERHFDNVIVIYVNRDLESAFITGADQALNVGVKDVVLQEEKIKAVVNAMMRCKASNLFVIDNINEADYHDFLKMKTTFQATHWKYLITTRTAPDDFEKLAVDELDNSDAALLFAYHYVPDNINRNDVNALDIIINDQGKDLKNLLLKTARHTLLLELLAKTGKKKSLTVPQLVDILKRQDLKDGQMDRDISIGAHAESTFREHLGKTTLHKYMLSIFETEYLVEATGSYAIDYENGKKSEMLQFFSVLPAEDIPIADLKILWSVDPDAENNFEDRLDELKQIGWLQGKQEYANQHLQHLSYKMHPLVQEVVYEKLKPGIGSCRPLIKSLTRILPQIKSQPQKFQNYAKSAIEKLGLFNR